MSNQQLKPEYQELADDFDLHYKDSGCSCHINPPCNHCIHPGHPDALAEIADAWEDIPDEPTDYGVA